MIERERERERKREIYKTPASTTRNPKMIVIVSLHLLQKNDFINYKAMQIIITTATTTNNNRHLSHSQCKVLREEEKVKGLLKHTHFFKRKRLVKEEEEGTQKN